MQIIYRVKDGEEFISFFTQKDALNYARKVKSNLVFKKKITAAGTEYYYRVPETKDWILMSAHYYSRD